MTSTLHPIWIAVLCLAAWVSSTAHAEEDRPAPRHVILFIIDGLAVAAPQRFTMPHWNQLAKEGCHYQAMHLPLPGHPKGDPRYPWSCSMPNPMLMSGTPFIGREGIRTAMIQHRFSGKESAFVVNAVSYRDVSEGFGTYISEPNRPDELVIEKSKEVILRDQPLFMRVHLQRAGIEGEKVGKERYADRPYYRNIWHQDSPYRKACENADQQLGGFVSWLKQHQLWEQTVLLICGDHGQADEGWHEPYSPPSSMTPLVIVGPGITAGQTFPYCEIFDLAPTIASLTRRDAPPLAMGRVLREALDKDHPAPATPRHVERLNHVLRAEAQADPAKRAALKEAGFLAIDELARWHTTDAGTDFAAFVSRQQRLYDAHR